ncbi:MAG: J domain-containing protein [Actinobacteria bacterium]|nr:J domain-containing protein [Actinomycetota bacterium]
MAADYYALLGVTPDASSEEIKRSYRRLARQLHPDANPDDPAAEARFKEVALAYETLSDPERRRRYDMFGPEGAAAGPAEGFGGGIGDLFDAFFGGDPFRGGGRGPTGPPRGADLEIIADLTFEQAVFGAEVPVTVRAAVPCDTCEASGCAPGTYPSSCPTCGGSGQVRRVRQSILGQMVTAGPCGQCGGYGTYIERPCPTCRGEGRHVAERTYTVEIPAGVNGGQTVRLQGRGSIGPRGGPPGDLYVHLRVRPHERFVREGDDLRAAVHVSFPQAALGTRLELETLDGPEEIVIAAGTQNGTVHALAGLGVPRLNGRGRGDLYVEVVVDVPTSLSREEDELLRQLAELQGVTVEAPDSGLMSKLRSAFK